MLLLNGPWGWRLNESEMFYNFYINGVSMGGISYGLWHSISGERARNDWLAHFMFRRSRA